MLIALCYVADKERDGHRDEWRDSRHWLLTRAANSKTTLVLCWLAKSWQRTSHGFCWHAPIGVSRHLTERHTESGWALPCLLRPDCIEPLDWPFETSRAPEQKSDESDKMVTQQRYVLQQVAPRLPARTLVGSVTCWPLASLANCARPV